MSGGRGSAGRRRRPARAGRSRGRRGRRAVGARTATPIDRGTGRTPGRRRPPRWRRSSATRPRSRRRNRLAGSSGGGKTSARPAGPGRRRARAADRRCRAPAASARTAARHPAVRAQLVTKLSHARHHQLLAGSDPDGPGGRVAQGTTAAGFSTKLPLRGDGLLVAGSDPGRARRGVRAARPRRRSPCRTRRTSTRSRIARHGARARSEASPSAALRSRRAGALARCRRRLG